MRALLDWAAASVAKKDPREQQAATAPPAAGGVPKLQPGCWATLRLALSDPALPGSLPLPPSLFPAIVATAQLLLRQPQQAERLASELAELLALLRAKFLASFRPGLEHCAALAEATLQGCEANAALPQPSAWRGLATNAALLLLVGLFCTLVASIPCPAVPVDCAFTRSSPSPCRTRAPTTPTSASPLTPWSRACCSRWHGGPGPAAALRPKGTPAARPAARCWTSRSSARPTSQVWGREGCACLRPR